MDKRDYTDPACPFDVTAWQPEAEDRTSHTKVDVPAFMRRYDELMAIGQAAEAGEVLRDGLAQSREAGDRQAELSFLSELMGYYRQAGQPAPGVEAAREGLELMRRLGLEGTVTAGTILINAATALAAFGQPEKALRHYEEAFRCYGRALDPHDLRYAGLMNNMAASYAAVGRRDDARRYYRGALKVLSGSRSPDIAVTHINLAQLCAGEDDDTARLELLAALDALDEPDMVWDSYYGYTCLKCAAALQAFGMEDDARELRERAEIIHESH